MKKLMMAMMAMVVMAAGVCQAAGGGMAVKGGGKLKPCAVAEMARYGASHVMELNAEDMVLTNADNTAVIWTNTVTAPCSVKFCGYVLDKAFDSATTNPGPYGITFSLGTSTTSTKWINAVQVAADATPTVYGSWGTDYTVSCMASGQAAVVTSPLLNAQTSDVTLLAKITPTTTNALSSLTVGKLRAYFAVVGQSYP